MKVLTRTQAKRIVKMAVSRMAEYIKEYDLETSIEGVSGGIDSAVMVRLIELTVKHLAKEGYEPREGVSHSAKYFFLDCHSKPFDKERADALADAFGINIEYVNLNYVYDTPLVHRAFTQARTQDLALRARGNAACRERMKFLYQEALLLNGVYWDTDDLSEEWMRFWTLKGDEGNAKVIQHLTKIEVYDLGEYLGVPQIILDSAPGDGLNVTETNAASDQLGLEYVEIDYIVSRFLGNGFKEFDSKKNKEKEYVQLVDPIFVALMETVASEIGRSKDLVYNVLRQMLKYSFKVKFGDNVVHLLPSRTDMKLPEPATEEFNSLYLSVIKSLKLT